MKFSTTQLLATLGLANLVAADFHVLTGPSSIAPGLGRRIEDYAVACPSNYYKCKCMIDGDRAGHVTAGSPPTYGVHKTGSNFFQLSGMCGVSNMNFYLQSDGTWLFYIAGGDGTVQGQCFPGDNSIVDCHEISAAYSLSNILVCYAYICNP
ncbi:hypothetical protein TARUN_3598 [Trichoderma arundinaceum]|uniref:Small secreted n=1 Tax=Trichoderma arundinaceum TaxID=490622 RepID=A0A395NRJ0_TRIAR|nr:hypothetical protein TARUN_3598 [Trichoderma arundinaceum]